MKITYNGITIPFMEGINADRLIISLSGGLDSAAATYLVCKHFPKTEIIPVTFRNKPTPYDSMLAQDIAAWFQEEFPNNNIQDLRIYDIDNSDPEGLANMKNEPDPWVALKHALIDEIIIELRREFPNCHMMTGITRNPPREVMEDIGVYDKAQTKRDAELPEMPIVSQGMIKPFNNVDKKFIADIYYQNNLMETLYPLTNSCIGWGHETDWFTKPCGKCYWCFEKEWAFADHKF